MNHVLRAMALTLLGIAVVTAALWLLTGERTGMKPVALKFFASYWSDDPGEAERMLTDERRAPSKSGSYELRMANARQQLGPYKGVVQVLVEEVGEQGDDGVFEARLAFEYAEAVVRLEMKLVGREWRVDAVDIAVERPVGSKRLWANPDTFGQAAVKAWAAGVAEDALWRSFDGPLARKWTLGEFTTATETFLEKTGKAQSVAIKKLEERDRHHATLHLTITFPDKPRAATLEMAWRSNRWVVDAFEVEDFE